ncbi:MAG: ankyrin repeat domain-containing protein [Gemmatimonadaceae bacterium]|nr:ankyrin repeat domain-containing protein [Gemmatimonadaceae bacterium]
MLITPLMVAAAMSSLPALEVLLAGGADPNATNEEGTTSLMYAAKESTDPAVIQTLLRSGADAQLRDRTGSLAIDHAQSNPALQNTYAFWELNDASY